MQFGPVDGAALAGWAGQAPVDIRPMGRRRSGREVDVHDSETTSRTRPVLLVLALLLALSLAAVGGLPSQPARASTSAAPTVLHLTVSAPRVAAGTAVTLTARLQHATDAAPVRGHVLELWTAPAGTTAWERIGTATSDANGQASVRHVPLRHSVLRATAPASATSTASTSGPQRVDVAQVVRAGLSTPAVRARTGAVVAGTVVPARAGRPVTLWLRSGGAWRAAATTRQSAAGAFRFAVTPTAPGWWRYRVTTPAGPDLLAGERALPALDAYRLHTYVVTRKGTTSDLRAFADAVAATYADPRGWQAAHRRFTRVASGGDFTVVLSEARLVPSFSPVCSARYSCRVGRHVIINDARWRTGSRPFPGPLAQYRAMVVNHETGHWLGLGHATCPRRGTPAPVMQQQSKGMQGCLPNEWPLPRELAAATPRS